MRVLERRYFLVSVFLTVLSFHLHVYGGEFTNSEIDIADDWLSQAVSIKYGSSNAVHDYDGKIESYSQSNTISGGPLDGTTYSSGSCAADVTGGGTGEINSSSEMLYHVYSPTNDESVNIGTSSQTLKPFMVDASGDTSVEIAFDGLLITDEDSTSASDWSKAKVEYLAEIQEYDSSSSSRAIVGDNTFDGVAWVMQAGNSSDATVVVPETYTWMEEEGAADNSWYNNNNLSVKRIVLSGATGDQINLDDISDAGTKASANTALLAGRTVYYLVYTETFDFTAEADKTYYVYMDLQTSAEATSGNWTDTAYAFSDFSNTINFTVTSGGQAVTTVVDLSDATLGIDNGNPTMGEDYVIRSGKIGTVSVSSGQTGTFTGDIEGAGALQKSGTGTMVVSGSNTYSGGTIVTAGTLKLGGSNTLPTSGDVTVASGATLDLNNNSQTIDALDGAGNVSLGSATLSEGGNGGSSTFSGAISGTGGLTKYGNGTLNLTGTNTAIGTLDITDGTVAVNGRWDGAVDISSGAVLQGTGRISGNVTNNGSYKPGNSIGTQEISGNYIQSSGGRLEIEVANQDNNSDKIRVGSNVAVDGTLYVSQTEEVTGTKSYGDIILAGGMSDGTFDTVTGDKELLYDYAVEVGDTYINLTVTKTNSYSDFASGGSSNIAKALDRILSSGTESGELATVMSSIGSGGASSVNEQLSQLSPANNSSVMSNMSMGLNSAYTQSVGQYVASARASARNAYAGMGNSQKLLASNDSRMYYTGYKESDSQVQGFVKGYGTQGDREAESGVAGYDYEIYGTIMGLNKLVSENFLAGITVGYANGNANSSDGLVQNSLETFSTSLYGSWFNYDSHLDVTVGYGHNWYDVERRIPVASRTAHSNPESDLWSVALEVGKAFYYENLTVEPFAGMSYSILKSGDYEESGAGTVGLSVDEDTSYSTDSTLGMRLSKAFVLGEKQWVSCATLGWKHNYSDNIQTTSKFIGDSTSFETKGIDVVRDTALMGINLESELSKDLKLFVDLDTEFSEQFTSYSGQIGIKYNF